MGCCGNPTGDTLGVIPFKRMSRVAPLSPDAPQQPFAVWRSHRWDTSVLEAVRRKARRPSIPRCLSASTATRQESTADPRRTSLPYRRSETRSPCARSRPSRAICAGSPTGSRPARSRRWRWNRPVSIGFLSSRFSRNAVSRSCSLTRDTSRTSPVERPTSWTVNGFKNFTASGCCAVAFDPMRRLPRCARISATEKSSFKLRHPISGVCRKRSSR